MMKPPPTITIVGAGLVGALLSIFLARRGFFVRVIERRQDMRQHEISAGRSINLAISTRGITALAELGLDREVLSKAVPMKGRMMHAQNSELSFQPYGTSDAEFLNSISRATLNKILMTHAEATGNVQFHFETRVTGIDFDSNELFVVDEVYNRMTKRSFDIVIGTDGSASAIRSAMQRLDGYSSESSTLDYGYKELVIPPAADGSFQLERNALHIWPRGNYMLIALPNFEGSFTCTLFLPYMGEVSFEHINTPEAAAAFFAEHFPDSVALIEDLRGTFQNNPMGHMTTVKCRQWHVEDKVLLMGDAAHAIVPFFGQGMNCGFEDCRIFDEQLLKFSKGRDVDWRALFAEMTRLRPADTDAIADMAVENFIEMRDKVGDQRFLLEKAVEKILQKTFPGRYVSRYALVTFSNVPYSFAQKVGLICDGILSELCANLNAAEDVDMNRAQELIDTRLSPVLSPYASVLSAVPSH
jgi:kynurenine 3-monooxygenase